MMPYKLAIAYEGNEQLLRAQQLAQQLNLPIDNEASARLIVMEHQLALKVEPFQLMHIDFNAQNWQSRRDAGKQQALVRACKPRDGMLIMDVTAGWGRDAARPFDVGAANYRRYRQPLPLPFRPAVRDRSRLCVNSARN